MYLYPKKLVFLTIFPEFCTAKYRSNANRQQEYH